MSMTLAQRHLLQDVTQFIQMEGRLQDEHAYDAWEALWTEDGIYWVPANGVGTDPENDMSIIYDNRSRIALRIRQYHTGKRFSQTPKSRLLRVISNVEVNEDDGKELKASANAIVVESNTRGEQIWASRNEYTLRRVDVVNVVNVVDGSGGDFRMALKKVILVNNEKPLYSMAFLI